MRKLLIIMYLIGSSNSFTQEPMKLDSTTIVLYNFSLMGDKLYSKLESFSKEYVNQDSTFCKKVFYKSDSTCFSKSITLKNQMLLDSVQYNYSIENKIDSAVWFYDSIGREVKYTWYRTEGVNSTLNWYSEYIDSVSYDEKITNQRRYRVDKTENYADTCCEQTVVKTFKNDILFEEIKFDESSDTIKTNYYYSKNGDLEKFTTQIYSLYDGVFLNDQVDNTDKCLKKIIVDFPTYSKIWTEDMMNSFLTDYVKYFNDLECKPQNLLLETEGGGVSIFVSKGNCHSDESGNIKMKIK